MQEEIQKHNQASFTRVSEAFDFLANKLTKNGLDVGNILSQLSGFQVAIPSWALGAGGTRFGRYGIGGEPANLEDKFHDVGLIHALTGCAGAISLHIPWDIPKDTLAIKELAAANGLVFDAVNSNTFQDQPGQKLSYKFGSLSNVNKDIRDLAIAHNKEVVDIGNALGSKSITVWLADGSNFPGQSNFRTALDFTAQSLQEIYQYMPTDWSLFIEYKPYEPHFYHTVIQDWGTSLMLANACGNHAFTLVDLGHHLPNTNIENIVSTLIYQGKLGGFHFNDSKYGDDDLTVGSIKPYQLFLIFNELVWGLEHNIKNNPAPAWMIDASHNLKDPIEDLIQSLDAILIAFVQALIIDQKALQTAQMNHDVSLAQEILQDAYRTDVRPLIQKMRASKNVAIDPLKTYRTMDIRNKLIAKRGVNSRATGL
ncbi:MAG TPA: TIM barrel protein [Saprospiraceae bacterium]|nr:TIM barrel protein [Saprospiraceae bacterium]HPN70218.1 TIM barrel protein [Saprospiraceae bacterium]